MSMSMSMIRMRSMNRRRRGRIVTMRQNRSMVSRGGRRSRSMIRIRIVNMQQSTSMSMSGSRRASMIRRGSISMIRKRIISASRIIVSMIRRVR